MKKISSYLSGLFLALVLLSLFRPGMEVRAQEAAGKTEENTARYQTVEELKGKKIAVLADSGFDLLLDEAMDTKNEYAYFSAYTDMLAALDAGRVEAASLDEPVAELAVHANTGLAIVPEAVMTVEYGIAFPKGSPLTAKFDPVIEQFREDGTLDALKEKWMGADESKKVLITQDWPGENGTIRYYHDATYSPMCYIGNGGESAGYDLDLVLMIARELDVKLEMTVCNFDSLIPAIQSGKADVVSGCMDITEERKKNVDFSVPYYDGAVVFVVESTAAVVEEGNMWTRLADSFRGTFLVEGRWRLILDGLGVTLLISVLSGVIGLLLGFGLCMLRRMKNRPSQIITGMFVRIIQGMPIVVFLMILYYIIFGSIDISAIAVSVVGFSINFGAYTSEMMRSGIDAVDAGQSEAAYAMGYTRVQTFWKIVFPQAAKHFLPVLKGEFISMVKMTSIVGYIAVQDLTKVSDIIRSRTMDAFFPLIITAVIYFVIANLLTMVLSLIERRVDPKRRKRVIKGVTMQ